MRWTFKLDALLRGSRIALAAAALALAAGLLATGPANAGTLFTLDSAITIDGSNNNGSGVEGTINPVNDLSGTILLSSGTADFTMTDLDVLVVDVTVTAGSIDALDIARAILIFGDPKGAGAMDDSGVAPTAGVSYAPWNFASGGVGSFDFTDDTITTGETTVRLFVTYTPGYLTVGDTANFMVSSGSDFTVQGTIVPEPSTLLLFGAGLLGIGFTARRSRAG